MKRLLVLIGLVGFPLSLWGQTEQVFFNLREHRSEYNGPGREEAEPEGLSEVLIGYFGPSDPSHPEGVDLWRAAELAVEEANREGGYKGIGFRLLSAWAENPWGTGIARLARMVYSEKVWALVGSIDGASTHLAEQVVAKARLALLNPASTDEAVNLANVAWTFSLPPDNGQIADVLAPGLVRAVAGRPFTLVSATDHDSRLLAAELRAALDRLQAAPRFHLNIYPGGEVAGVVSQILVSECRGVLVVAGARDSARTVVELRRRGFQGAIIGGPSMGRRSFVDAVGSQGEGVVFPLLGPSPPEAFASRFRERFSHEPDYAAAEAYDAVRLLVEAIRRAGLNRARIRDAVAAFSPWQGVSGTIRWDPLGQNQRPVRLGTLRGGRCHPLVRALPLVTHPVENLR